MTLSPITRYTKDGSSEEAKIYCNNLKEEGGGGHGTESPQARFRRWKGAHTLGVYSRGNNPNSKKNLKPLNKRTMKEQREIQKKGGAASGEARATSKTLREYFIENTTEEIKKAMWEALKQKAIKGDVRAFVVYRDTIGEKPTDKMNIYNHPLAPPPIIIDDWALMEEIGIPDAREKFLHWLVEQEDNEES